jgi:hypothetical protein
VDPRAGLGDLKRKFLTLPGLELRLFTRPARIWTALSRLKEYKRQLNQDEISGPDKSVGSNCILALTCNNVGSFTGFDVMSPFQLQ